jgi:hypothetical protein
MGVHGRFPSLAPPSLLLLLPQPLPPEGSRRAKPRSGRVAAGTVWLVAAAPRGACAAGGGGGARAGPHRAVVQLRQPSVGAALGGGRAGKTSGARWL